VAPLGARFLPTSETAELAGRSGWNPEARLATRATLTCAVLAPVAALVALPLAGVPGAIGAASGVAIIGLLSAVMLPLHHWAGGRSTQVVVAVACTGLGLRLALAAGALTISARLTVLSPASLAIGFVVALVAVTAAEMRLVASDPRHAFIDASLAPANASLASANALHDGRYATASTGLISESPPQAPAIHNSGRTPA